jgi:Restriction endonuclease
MASKSDLPPSVPPGTVSRDGFQESEEGEAEGPSGESDHADHMTPASTAAHAIGSPQHPDLKPRLDISLPVTDISIVPGDAENPDRLRRRREVREKQEQAERYLRAMGQVPSTHTTPDIPWQERLLECVLKMKPDAFERLCQRILKESGFIKVDVTGRSGDGGIDGIGVLRLNLLSFHVFFQCKRWKGSVGAPVIRDFRGAMVGRADKGLVMTTGMFTVDARKEATRGGAPPIDLIDGEALCELLKDLKIGVETRKVEQVFVEQQAFLKF